MDITISEKEGCIIAAIIGDLDNAASTQAERSFLPVFESTDKDVVIDCTGLNYISSSGLRIMLNIYKHTRANGHTVTLRGMSDDVLEVFGLSGFLQLFKVEQ
jgi:anti-sigma B factor antagonist